MIIRGGGNIYPREIEELLQSPSPSRSAGAFRSISGAINGSVASSAARWS